MSSFLPLFLYCSEGFLLPSLKNILVEGPTEAYALPKYLQAVGLS